MSDDMTEPTTNDSGEPKPEDYEALGRIFQAGERALSQQPDSVDSTGQPADTDEPGVFDRAYVERLRQENARYRTGRQHAERKLAALQRQQVEAHAAAAGLKPAALWATARLEDLTDSTGSVDGGLVADAIRAAREQLGINPQRPTGPLRSGAMAQEPPQPDRWTSAFAPRDRGR
jgi:hypothetical protein